MYHTFKDLINRMNVFNQWNFADDAVAKRVKSIERKLLNAMFFVENADEYPRSLTADTTGGLKEMRALDAYTDAAMAELHGVLDMLASTLCIKYNLTNRRGGSYSFAQMFVQNGQINTDIAPVVGSAVEKILIDLKVISQDLIDENNTAKHSEMKETFLYPVDYPDSLKELSETLYPQMITNKKNIRDLVLDRRTQTNEIGERICNLVPQIFL